MAATPHTRYSEEVIMQVCAEAEALDNLSNSVIDLMQAGEFDEAEKAGHQLLDRYGPTGVRRC